MKKYKMRPAEEEMGSVPLTFLFSILWYGSLLGGILNNGFQTSYILFLAAGLLPLYMAVNNIRRAMFYRRQRAEAVAYGHSQTGWIRGVVREDVPYRSGEHNTLRYRRHYRLKIEVTDPMTGITNTIMSQDYLKPIHRYLSSPKVRVYTDKSGWKHYIEEFQWKEHKNDPDIFEYPREFDESRGGYKVIQTIVIVLMILMIIQSFFRR